MSAVTNMQPMSFSNDVQNHYDSSQFMTESPLRHPDNSFQGLQNHASQEADKGDDRRLKDQMQESLQIQQIQAEQSQSVPQQYQFQGPMPLQLKYAFRPGQKPSFPTVGDPDFDGRRLRRTTMRKTVDYNSAIIKELENRLWQRDYRDREHLQPDVLYIPHILPPPSYRENPFNAVTTRFVKTATNKVRCPVFCLAWTPEGRRLITGTSSGEFTLWNGLTFNFETILQAHDCPVRTMVWSNNELWMLTGDHSGFIKYWQSNMNNVKMYQGHREAVRGVSFSPTDNKFVSCSDDGTVRLWDFITCNEERIFRGHGADVKCVHWHPYKSLVASGSKDNQQPVKLWDPRSGKSIATIHAHKATVMDIKWNQNGNWVATASRDHLIKLYDIRNLNTDMQVFRGHKKETSVIAWHPQHEGLMCSGGSDGSILFWHVGTPKEVAAIDQAHDSIVWALAWHPLGHILCSGSNDHSCKFWTRNHPGDPMRDKYNLNTFPASILGFEEYEDESGTVRIPGMGPEDKVDISKLPENIMSSIPGLDSGIFKDKNKPQKKVPYAKPIPKNFQAQWNSESRCKDSNTDENFMPDSKMLLNKLFEHAPRSVNVKDLKVDGLYIYGKVVTVADDSELARVVAEGRDKVVDFVNKGNVTELQDVIPHLDADECVRRYKTQNLMKSRGRQFNEAISSMINQIKKPDRSSLKRSKETSSTVPAKKWRSEKVSSDFRDSGSVYSSKDSYSEYPSSYNDPDYRGSSKDSSKGYNRNDSYNYEDYDDYDQDYEEGELPPNYSDKRNYSKNSWKDDGYHGRYSNSDKNYGWNKYSENKGYKGNSSLQSSHLNRSVDEKRSSGSQNQSSDSYYESSRVSKFSDGDRRSSTSRFSDSEHGSVGKATSSRGRRGSGGFSRRPFGGNSRGPSHSDSYSSSRFSSGQNDRYSENEDDYYDRESNRDPKDDYSDDRDYDRYENNDNYYEDFADDNVGPSYRGSRGGRFQSSRGRGGETRGRRGSYGRGSTGGSSWRGPRGKDVPRRSRGRGSRWGV